MAEQNNTTTALIIAGTLILQDSQGLYNLNSLHHASETKAHKKPSNWLDLLGTQELIAELNRQRQDRTFDVVKGGNAPGIYAHELLAVSYAGWISPAFQLKVNQAFLDMRRGKNAQTLMTRGDLLVQMAEAYRAQEQRLIAVEAAQQLQALQLIEQQASVIAHLQLIVQANDKADHALQQQQWMTLREYVFTNDLTHQLPPTRANEYGKWLAGYCLEKNVPVRRIPIADRPYETENGYHVGTIEATMPGWVKRRESQAVLTVLTHTPETPND